MLALLDFSACICIIKLASILCQVKLLLALKIKRKRLEIASTISSLFENQKRLLTPDKSNSIVSHSPIKIKENNTMNETLNPRQIRGIDIAKRYVIKQENDVWLVPSSSGKSTRYQVCLKSNKCTCRLCLKSRCCLNSA